MRLLWQESCLKSATEHGVHPGFPTETGGSYTNSSWLLQVVLTSNVPKLGQQGELLSLQNGFVTNYLVPQGLARVATKEILACDSMSQTSLVAGHVDLAQAAQAQEQRQRG